MCETDKNINKQTDGRRNLLGVPAFVKVSQKHEIPFISFAQLNYFWKKSNFTSICMHRKFTNSQRELVEFLKLNFTYLFRSDLHLSLFEIAGY